MRIVDFLKGGVVNSIKRFPVVTLVVLFAMYIGFQLVYLNYSNNDYTYTSKITSRYIYILCLCNFTMLLGLTFDLFVEKNKSFSMWRWPLRILTVLIGVLMYYFIDVTYMFTNQMKIVVLCLAGHFAVSSFPFIIDKNWHGFWEFNKELFLRVIVTGFYSGVIYLGLALAILAQKELLNLYEDGDVYGYMAVFVFIGFNTLFFISGIPRLDKEEEQQVEYPSGLKIFAGYVILPLVALYMFILLTFELKIVLQSTLPEGFVSWMIFCFAVAGILAFLLLYPIIGQKENKWIRVSLRVFAIALIPLLVLLWWAIIIRLDDYGWTEMRYLHFGLSLWLTFFVLYFIIKNDKVVIKWLPLSLALFFVISSFGPWGFSAISKNVQLGYVKKFVETKDSTLGPQMYSKIDYLVEFHGYQSLSEFITEKGKSEIAQYESDNRNKLLSSYDYTNIVHDHLTFEIPESNGDDHATYVSNSVHISTMPVYKLQDYAYAVMLPSYLNEPFVVDHKGLSVDVLNVKDEKNITVKYDGKIETIDLKKYVETNMSDLKTLSYSGVKNVATMTDKELLTFPLMNNQVKLIIHEMDFSYDKDTVDNVWNINAVILFN